MRMWMVDPEFMCRNHLLGEHAELHKFRHNFEKHHSITGRVFPEPAIEPKSMAARHDELVEEMVRRGYNHNSPYTQPDLSYLSDEERGATVDREYSLKLLHGRCPQCKNLWDVGVCLSKVVYHNKQEALRAAQLLMREVGVQFAPYPCGVCYNFHLTSGEFVGNGS